MTAISGTIITYNEADHIQDCIRSLLQVCDDIVVVDSVSTDDTVTLARALGATVIDQPYLGEGPQRNITEKHARHDWILALDADERLDAEMVASVQRLHLDNPQLAYAFNRKSFVGQRWIKGPGFYPDFVTRLYNRTASAYEPKAGHAGVIAPQVERCSGHILHYTYDDISDWITKINQVTSLDAKGMYESGNPASSLKPISSAFAAGFRQLILRGGIFKGMDGLTITVTTMFRCYMKYLKLNELHAGKEKSRTSSRSG